MTQRASLRSQRGGILLPVFIVLLFASAGLLVFLGNQRIHSTAFLSLPAHLQARLNARGSAMRLFNTIQSQPSTGTSESAPCDTLTTDSTTEGRATASCITVGLTAALSGTGICRAETATVAIILAGSLFASDDTVLYCSTKRPAGGLITGAVAIRATDSSKSLFNASRIEKTLASLMPQTRNDTALMAMPLLVQSSAAGSKIPARVRGPLFIDGTYRPVTVDIRDTITVLGDLQFTGAVVCNNVLFRVLGEVRISDQAHLRNVRIFSAKRILVGGQTQGRDIELSAKKSVSVYDHAEIIGTSTCATFDDGDTANGGTTIYLLDQSRFMGALVSVKGSVRIDRSANAAGVILAQGDLSCAGQFNGIASVKSVSDRANGHAVENILTGRIGPFKGAHLIPLPWFVGKPVIDNWEEH